MTPRIRKISELRRELAEKEKQLDGLLAQRIKLAAKLESIDRKLIALGGEVPPPRRRRGRPPGTGKAGRKVRRGRRPLKRVKKVKKRRRATGKPLIKYLRKVLGKSEAPMRVKDIVQAVRKTAYKSYSKDFYGIVATALRDKNNFKRAGRGVYALAK